MKKQLRLFALAALVSSFALAGLVAACGDDTVVTIDGGTEAGADSTADVYTPDTGATDSGTPDVITVPDFVGQIENALCGSLARCCFGNADLADGGAVDGGTYNGGRCLAAVKDLGFEFSSVGAQYIDGGTVVIDPTKATECATLLKGLACNLPASALRTARAACFAAFVGKHTAGQACIESIECPTGHLCDPTADGGTCQPLRGDGGSCAVYPLPDGGDEIVNAVKNEEACSTRGGGDTNLHCLTYDPNSDATAPPNYYLPRDQWKCVPNVGTDAPCNSTVWCADGICETREAAYVCKNPVEYFATQCAAVINP